MKKNNEETHLVSPELWEEMLKAGWNKKTILDRAIATEILEELPYEHSTFLIREKTPAYTPIYRTEINDPLGNFKAHYDKNPCDALALLWLYLNKK